MFVDLKDHETVSEGYFFLFVSEGHVTDLKDLFTVSEGYFSFVSEGHVYLI